VLKQIRTPMFLIIPLLSIWMVSSGDAADKPELYLQNNVLAAGKYNDGTGSSDLTLIIRVEADGEIVVDEGATVRYIVPQKDIKDWTELDFDDSDWGIGTSGVGYGDTDDNTPVRGNIPSAYTRYYFDVPNAGKIDELTFLVDYDDAYILWLNGVEIARSSGMAAFSRIGDAPAWDATAGGGPGHGSSELPAGQPNENRWKQGNLATHFVEVDFGGQEPEGVQVNPPKQTTPTGAPLYLKDNVLAGANFNDGPGSSDMTLIIRLMGDDEIYVDEGHEVKYIHDPDNADVEDSWIETDFDDSGWADGFSGVGFSDGDDNTTTPAALISIWTRYHFDAPDADKIKELVLLADYDDSFIAWLNGVPIAFSGGAPGGDPPAWNITQGGGAGHGSAELPAGKPNEARWKHTRIQRTIVRFRYAGTSAFAVDARNKLPITWGNIKKQK
jgi:hypothetical protein